MIRIGDLLPDTVSCVLSDHAPETTELLAAENAAAKNMRHGRLIEFAHGRACARRALARLGIPACPIPVGDGRAPVWPDQVVGSISHCGKHAAAVATYRRNTQGLGIDLETTDHLERPLLNVVCRPEELLWLNTSASNQILDKLFFSAKESLFKCVWPTVHRFIDFQEIEINLDLANNSYTATSHSSELAGALINRIRGKYLQNEELIITTAYLA